MNDVQLFEAFLRGPAFKQALTRAIVEIEEERLITECLNDTCGHDVCPDPPGIGCGDTDKIIELMLQ